MIRADRSVKSVMNAIDALSERIPGTRAVYEMLSEFAHPNVGLILSLTKNSKLRKDDKGVYWVEKTLSLRQPMLAAKELAPALNRMFLTVSDCAVHFINLINNVPVTKSKLVAISQVVVRKVLACRSDLVMPYSLCPCDSGKKVKFCCGQRNK